MYVYGTAVFVYVLLSVLGQCEQQYQDIVYVSQSCMLIDSLKFYKWGENEGLKRRTLLLRLDLV